MTICVVADVRESRSRVPDELERLGAAVRPPYAQLPKRSPARVPEAMLAAVPGISTERARALLREFETVAGVLAAGPEAWRRVNGVGSHRTRALEQALHGKRSSPSWWSREGRGPST